MLILLNSEGPERDALDWNPRIKIAAKAAMGLQYLHRGMKPPVLYGDVKSSNIFLGWGYATKLSDFGLSKEGKVFIHDEDSKATGTEGYHDPDYAATRVLKPEADIYSFGLVLLELFTGRSPLRRVTFSPSMTLADWATTLFKNRSIFSQIADPVLQGQCAGNSSALSSTTQRHSRSPLQLRNGRVWDLSPEMNG